MKRIFTENEKQILDNYATSITNTIFDYYMGTLESLGIIYEDSEDGIAESTEKAFNAILNDLSFEDIDEVGEKMVNIISQALIKKIATENIEENDWD